MEDDDLLEIDFDLKDDDSDKNKKVIGDDINYKSFVFPDSCVREDEKLSSIEIIDNNKEKIRDIELDKFFLESKINEEKIKLFDKHYDFIKKLEDEFKQNGYYNYYDRKYNPIYFNYDNQNDRLEFGGDFISKERLYSNIQQKMSTKLRGEKYIFSKSVCNNGNYVCNNFKEEDIEILKEVVKNEVNSLIDKLFKELVQ